jgi:ATP-binding cassette subfamily E protein 1
MSRIAIVDRSKCIREKCGYICVKVCPGVRMGDETVTVDSEGWPVISEMLCTGCGICPKRCPVDAITIINLAQELTEPFHSYGINSFRLYNMPLPQKTGVVGLIGKNGIGKSTAIKILSGRLAPNLGAIDGEEQKAKMNIEQKAYFSKLGQNGLSISYKPQNIEKITDLFKGTVSDLFEKTEKMSEARLNTAVEKLSISPILSREIRHLSGGELQRVAIAAAYSKDADLYYFDEPASYLDIEQRLAMANLIQSLSEQKPVIVVEHDLALFDYLSDYVYVFYGEENAYGVVSGVKSARTGIGEYLEGYLKSENVRFRTEEIKFEKYSAEAGKGKAILSYPEMRKSFDSFSLSCEEGSLNAGEIVGIVGRNAVGKTVFIKMLAGLEHPDNDAPLPKLKVSYKPQYIRAETEMTVLDLFNSLPLNSFVLEECKRRLLLHSLLERSVMHLSGGELQRVSIATALSQEADIYLFDEPSAFLDIEQRLHFAHLLRSVIADTDKVAFVVDHDVVLIDLVSNRIMPFEGQASINGHAPAPMKKRDGMNKFLSALGITLRRDKSTLRPRINKAGSVLDREQKEMGEYYYVTDS